MSDSKHSMNAVPVLLEERRRYETWLAALEARRDSTPNHVFDRVHADYTTRLRRVEEQLSSHHQSIQDERVSVQSRLALLEAEERMRLDERAELELRMQVGELTGPDAISAAGAVDDAIHQYATERTHLMRQLSELDALLAERAAAARASAAARMPAPAPAAAPAPAPVSPAPASPAPPAPRPEAVPPRVAPRPSAAVAAPPPPVSPPAPGAPAPHASQSMPQAAPASGSFDELAFLSTVVGAETPGQAASAAQPPMAGDVNAAPAAQPAPTATATPPGPTAHAPQAASPTVQPMPRLRPLPTQPRADAQVPAAPPPPRPSAGIIRDDAAAKSLLDGIGSGGTLGGERPLAANDPANTPIVLRTSGSNEQSKTLRCAECGAMNYPTEWYCERCGAELAAL